MMASGRSSNFQLWCYKFLPFLFSKCPMGNQHPIWQPNCSCGKHEYSGDHQGDVYVLKNGRWNKVGR